MKLYTRTGDDGSTGLFGGQRVPKTHPRVQAYGAVDELNAALALAVAGCPIDDTDARLRDLLISLQSRLFDLGADLATPPGSKHEDKIARITNDDVTEIESWIDEIDAANSPMQNFVLPGGCELSARLDVARTIARRAERAVFELAATDEVGRPVLLCLNRLSDLLFAMARAANRLAGVDDVPWTPKNNPV